MCYPCHDKDHLVTGSKKKKKKDPLLMNQPDPGLYRNCGQMMRNRLMVWSYNSSTNLHSRFLMFQSFLSDIIIIVFVAVL